MVLAESVQCLSEMELVISEKSFEIEACELKNKAVTMLYGSGISLEKII